MSWQDGQGYEEMAVQGQKSDMNDRESVSDVPNNQQVPAMEAETQAELQEEARTSPKAAERIVKDTRSPHSLWLKKHETELAESK